jgi:Novel toxin 16
MKHLICLATALLLAGTAVLTAQTKEVNDPCEGDKDCKSGNCVTTKSGEKKCSDCDQSKLRSYTEKVDEKCKDWDKGILGYSDLKNQFGSKTEVSLMLLNMRKEACKGCYDARSERENTCWKGGDPGHKKQMEEMVESMRYIDGVMDEKKRYYLAYKCEPGKYEDLVEDITDNCKGLDELFAKYGLNDNKEGSCREIEDLIDKCIDCREAWTDLVYYCFDNSPSAERTKRFNEVKDMEKIAKETLAEKKSKNLCK